MASQIQLRRDTAATWTSANPTLASGEIGLETDTNKIKFGDGATAWTALGYYGFASINDIGDVTISGASSGEVLQWNGAAWVNAAIDALPSQTGNGGKYLTTDGSTASWDTIVTDPNPQIFMMMGA
jgi:hypothetical protein